MAKLDTEPDQVQYVERAAHEALEAKLVRAMRRGKMKEATPEFWEQLREEVLGDD